MFTSAHPACYSRTTYLLVAKSLTFEEAFFAFEKLKYAYLIIIILCDVSARFCGIVAQWPGFGAAERGFPRVVCFNI
jgi:hypothetical protein